MSFKNIASAYSTEISSPNMDYYRKVLDELLEPLMPGYSEFFGNINRLRMLNWFIAQYFHVGQGKVLNVGCGAFAIEILLPDLTKHDITSFDYTKHFAVLYEHFRQDGYLSNTRFFVGDARLAEFPENSFDLIIMNDIFYEVELSFEAMLEKYAVFLKPGGFLVFDIMDTRTQWIWSLLGKEAAYRRYDRRVITSLLLDKGFKCMDCLPALGNKFFWDKLFRRVLWHGFGLSNNFTFLVQKMSAPK